MTWPWPPAAATGIGSLPGADAFESARVVAGEVPELVHVVELPARGPGADMIGRTASQLARVSEGLGVETTPDGWRLTPGIGRTVRRAWSWLGEDLDALQSAAGETTSAVKGQLAGPWTLAANLELSSGERALRDPGACRDIAQALAEAAAEHVRELRRRFPRAAAVLLQLDVPMLPAVLAGTVGTASGLATYRAVAEPVAVSALRTVVNAATEAGAVVGMHCCADDPPIGVMRSAGAQFISIDLLRTERLGARADEALAAAWESGVALFCGTVSGPSTFSARQASRPIRELADRAGLSDPRHMASIVVTPACGLAAASPSVARGAYAACRAASAVLRDAAASDAEGGRRG
jgi:methionine synthase II (cobalamin-independent)